MINSLIQKAKKVKDFRKKRGKRHELWVVIVMITLANLMGDTSYKDIALFIANNKERLKNALNISASTMPSLATIRRILMGVNPDELNQILYELVQENWPIEAGDWVAIDGKNLKNTEINWEKSNQNVCKVVSSYSQDKSLIIDTKYFPSKQVSENEAVLDMIRLTELKGVTFSLDALHASEKTTAAIVASENHYLVTVKGNASKLYRLLKNSANSSEALSKYHDEEKSHNRTIVRDVLVFSGEEINHEKFPHIQSFIKVSRKGKRGREKYEQTNYYISSQKLSADIFAERIKGHWLIENQLHWVKDVVFQEDSWLLKDWQASQNLSLLCSIVMNVYRSLGFISIKDGMNWLGNDWEKILAIS
jgi:predicted transposase YbfD/YdcC